MSTNPVIDTGSLSRSIVKELFAQGIQDFADDTNSSLDDPISRDSNDAPFVVTSWPNQGLRYPHIVVSESSINSESFDNRHELFESDVTVQITVAARQSTEKFKIKDGVRDYVVKNQSSAIKEGGFADGSIDSSGPSDWEEDPEVQTWQAEISGLVYHN